MILIDILFLLTAVYVAIILCLSAGLLYKVKKRKPTDELLTITVVVAARNESSRIIATIQALQKQIYDQNHWEAIIIDDHSSDSTFTLADEYIKNKNITNIQIIHAQTPTSTLLGKKNALDTGIKIAKGEIIAVTDADCIPSETWLVRINEHFVDDVDWLAGYSPLYTGKSKILQGVKNVERASIFAVTAGSFFLRIALTCTARNMAYRKTVFTRVGGFSGIGHIQSGDDDLLLLKSRKAIKRYTFMYEEDSHVPAFDIKTKAQMINQETRRASKWIYYPLYLQLICVVVFAFFLALLVAIVASIFVKDLWIPTLLSFVFKSIAEIVLITTFLLKIKRVRLLPYLLLAEIGYIPYFIFFALRGLIGSYKWKS